MDTLGFGPLKELFIGIVRVDLNLIQTGYDLDPRFEEFGCRLDTEIGDSDSFTSTYSNERKSVNHPNQYQGEVELGRIYHQREAFPSLHTPRRRISPSIHLRPSALFPSSRFSKNLRNHPPLSSFAIGQCIRYTSIYPQSSLAKLSSNAARTL